MTITIEKLKQGQPPYSLLLLADPSRQMIDSYLPKSEVLLAIHGGETIGVCVLFPLENGQMEVKNIAVREDWQRKGIATQLLEYAIKHAARAGCPSLWIGTGNSSLQQLSLYQKLGFEMAYIRKNYFVEHYPQPIEENGIPCKHLVMLGKVLVP